MIYLGIVVLLVIALVVISKFFPRLFSEAESDQQGVAVVAVKEISVSIRSLPGLLAFRLPRQDGRRLAPVRGLTYEYVARCILLVAKIYCDLRPPTHLIVLGKRHSDVSARKALAQMGYIACGWHAAHTFLPVFRQLCRDEAGGVAFVGQPILYGSGMGSWVAVIYMTAANKLLIRAERSHVHSWPPETAYAVRKDEKAAALFLIAQLVGQLAAKRQKE